MFFSKRRKIFNDVLTEWLNKKEEIKLQSKQSYARTIQYYIAENIGMIKSKKIKISDVKNLMLILEKQKVALSVRKKVLYILKSSINYGITKRYCKKIDFSEIKMKNESKKIYVLSKNNQVILENYLKNKPNIRKIFILISLYTGLRVGELAGLKWEDIDFNDNCLYVKRTIQRIQNFADNESKTKLIESTPKSETSARTVPLSECIVEMLKIYKSNNEYFILSDSTSLYDPRLLESFFSRCLTKCNISHVSYHTLRHTFATRSLESGMDIKALSEILGHSNIEITLAIYVHPSFDYKKHSIEKLAQFMNLNNRILV